MPEKNTAITLQYKPKLKNPILIAAWPGMGYVAIKAAVYLKDKLKAKPFACFKSKAFFYPTDVAIHKGVIEILDCPDGQFFHWENKSGKNDIIFFISDWQPPAEKNLSYAELILSFAKGLGVQEIITFAAMLTSNEHIQNPQVWFATTDKKKVIELEKHSLKAITHAEISGLNGFLLGMAKKNGMEGFCLLGEVPFYATQIENPKSSMSVLKVLTRLFNLHIDFKDLSLAGEKIEEEVEQIVDYLKKPVTTNSSGEDNDKPLNSPISLEEVEAIKNILAAQRTVPHSAKKQIEELFVKSREDITYAIELKSKLDEWNIYRDYEDRFLQLFREAG